jgi:glycerophosphoryl diester phosphodiesterase
LSLRNGENSIPTLDEFFDLLEKHKDIGGNDILLHLEAKMEDGLLHLSASPELLAKNTLESIARKKPKNKIIVRSFYWGLVGIFKDLKPTMPRILLVDEKQLEGIDIAKAVEKYQPVEVSPNYKDVTADLVKAWQKFGVKISPWTVNDFGTALNLIKMGVSGLATDNPDLMKAYLQAQGIQAQKHTSCQARLK